MGATALRRELSWETKMREATGHAPFFYASINACVTATDDHVVVWHNLLLSIPLAFRLPLFREIYTIRERGMTGTRALPRARLVQASKRFRFPPGEGYTL
jgi:hypothetical protein